MIKESIEHYVEYEIAFLLQPSILQYLLNVRVSPAFLFFKEIDVQQLETTTTVRNRILRRKSIKFYTSQISYRPSVIF